MSRKQIINKIKKELKETKDKLIYGVVISPHINDLEATAWCWKNQKITGLASKYMISIYLNNAAEGHWILDRAEYRIFSEYMMKHQPEVLRHFKQWQKEIKEYNNLFNNFLKKGSQNWLKDYLNLKERFIALFGRAAIIENVSWETENLLEQIKSSYKLTDKVMIALLQEPKKSFLGKNEQSLKNIALKAYNLTDYSYQDLEIKQLDISRLIKEHQQKFFWIENNFHDAKIISPKEFWERTKKIIKSYSQKELSIECQHLKDYQNRVRKEKIKIKNKYQISNKDFKTLQFLSTLAWWQDARKACALLMSHWTTEFMKMAAKKYQVPFNDLRYLTSDEFINFLKKNGQYNKKQVKERQKRAVQIHLKTGENYIVSGNSDLKKLIKELLREEWQIKDNKIEGIVVSKGKVAKIQGKVRIVPNPKGVRLIKGEILVASMTRPEYIPLMKEAGAIITDGGGITCHAAIVSRELNKPCIINTKIATKALRNGDLVEVDTNKGIARILKIKKARAYR